MARMKTSGKARKEISSVNVLFVLQITVHILGKRAYDERNNKYLNSF
jgi:hypothetical protein